MTVEFTADKIKETHVLWRRGKMELLKITKDIASEVSRIYALSWKTAYKNMVPQKYLDELSLEYWTSFLQESPAVGYVLKVEEELVATSSISPARDAAMRGWGEILSIYVLPQHFHKGYGKALLSFVISQLQSSGFSDIYLWVLEENQHARSFYERNGFTTNGDKETINIGGKDLIELRYVYKANGG